MDDFDMLTPEDLNECYEWNEVSDFLYYHWLRETDEGVNIINEWALAAAEVDAIELQMENV